MATKKNVAISVMETVGEATDDVDLRLQFEKWVQQVYDEIGSEIGWDFLRKDETITTVASTEEYSTQIDTYHITAVRIDPDDDPIRYRSVEDLIRYGYDLNQAGRPEYWYPSGYDEATKKNLIRFWPIPDSAFNIQVFEEGGPKLLGSEDEVPLPRVLDYVLEDGVEARYLRNESDYEGANLVRTDFFIELSKQKIRLTNRPNNYLRLQVTDIPRVTLGEVRLPPDTF